MAAAMRVSYGDASSSSSSSSLPPPPSAAAFAAPYLGAAAPPAGPPDGELGVSSARLVARMREVEQEGRIFNASAGYVKVRRVLVDFLCEAGEELRLHGSTMHVAVGYLDRVLQIADFRRDRYYLVAVTCLIIAAKYEEKEEGCVPSAERLLAYLRAQGQANEYSLPHFVHQMEVSILTILGWSLTVVTPQHLLGLYHRRGLVFTSDTMGFEPLVPKVLDYLKKYADFYADLCLQEYSFQQYPPSLLAAAIVLAARKAINIRPLWCAALEPVLGYSEAACAGAFAHVWDNYSLLFPEDARLALKREKTAERKAVQLGLIPAPPGFSAHDPSAAPPPPQPQQLAALLSPAFGGGGGGAALATPATPQTVASNPHEDASTSTAGGSGSGMSAGYGRSGGALSVGAAGGGGGGGGAAMAADGRHLSFSGFGGGSGGGGDSQSGEYGSGTSAAGGGASMVLSPAAAAAPRERERGGGCDARASLGDELMQAMLSPAPANAHAR